MNHVDTINAAFELGGAIFLLFNVRRLLKDKTVKGVSLVPHAWWTLWGFWNVYFYSAVAAPLSFWAGIAVVSVQATWFTLALYYTRKEADAAQYQIEALILFTPDAGRTWHNSDGPMGASELTDRLQDYYLEQKLRRGELQ